MTAKGVDADSWNSVDDLQDAVSYAKKLQNVDTDKLLERAHRRVVRKFGRTIDERLYQDKEDQRVWYLRFSRVVHLEEVRRNDKLVDSSDYTFTNDEAKIEFTESYADDKLGDYTKWRVTVEYTPWNFVDLELYYAIKEFLARTVVQLNDDEEENNLEQWERLIESTEKEINSYMPPQDRAKGKKFGSNRRRRTTWP